jgi:hypothetical protein
MPDDTEIDESSGSENEYEEADHSKDENEDDNMAEQTYLKNEDGDRTQAKKPKLDPKDPLRPRRKKARRACFACQRAHLTCGMSQLLSHKQRVIAWSTSDLVLTFHPLPREFCGSISIRLMLHILFLLF